MKNLNYLDKYRIPHPITGTVGNGKNGAFALMINGRKFYVIASSGLSCEHVSVSPVKAKELPTWQDMCAVKDMFFEENETVVRHYPAVNKKMNVVHLWRPLNAAFPMTPPEMKVKGYMWLVNLLVISGGLVVLYGIMYIANYLF